MSGCATPHVCFLGALPPSRFARLPRDIFGKKKDMILHFATNTLAEGNPVFSICRNKEDKALWVQPCGPRRKPEADDEI